MGPEARRALADACRADTPVARLRRGARASGLELYEHRLTLRALGVSAPAWPLLRHSPAHEGFLVIEGAKRGRMRVRALNERGPGPASWVAVDELARLLGVSADEEIELLQPGDCRPLEGLRGKEATPWRRLWALVRTERRDLWVVVAYAVAVGGLSLATPLAVQALINTVAFGTLLQPLVVLGVLLMAALAASAVFRLFEMMVVELLARRVFVRTALDFSRRVPIVQRQGGPGRLQELLNRFYDVVVVEKALTSLLFDGLSALLQIGVGMLLLAVYHPILLAFDLGMVLVLSVIVFGLGRHAVYTALVESKKKHAVASWLEVLASTPATFRSVRGQSYAHARADEVVQGWLQARSRHFRILLRQQGGMLALQAVASALLVLIGGFLVLERQLSLGQLVAAEVIMTLTVGALGKVGKLLGKLYDLLAALDKLGSVVDLPLADTGTEHFDVPEGPMGLRLEHPTLSFDVAPGAHVALVGGDLVEAHGLVDWVVGLRGMKEGQLYFGGMDARTLDSAEVADRVAVLDKGELFEGTLRDNVTVGDLGVTSGRIRDALAKVGLQDIEQRLPDGLDTVLGRDGEPLSESAQALLQVARVVARQPSLVVIDRLFDDLPQIYRQRALDVLLAPGAPWTTICVTDQPDVLERFAHRVTADEAAAGLAVAKEVQ